MLLKINLLVSDKTIRDTKKIWVQNCLSEEDIQIYLRALFDRTRSFGFNCKKRYQILKILLCTKSMRGTKKALRKKIVRLK